MCEKVDPAGEFGFSWLILLQVRKVASKERRKSRAATETRVTTRTLSSVPKCSCESLPSLFQACSVFSNALHFNDALLLWGISKGVLTVFLFSSSFFSPLFHSSWFHSHCRFLTGKREQPKCACQYAHRGICSPSYDCVKLCLLAFAYLCQCMSMFLCAFESQTQRIPASEPVF